MPAATTALATLVRRGATSVAIVTILGGNRSGKSSAAEQLARQKADQGKRVAVLCFGARGVDPEFDGRIQRHVSDRPQSWVTLEPDDLGETHDLVSGFDVVVVDCLGSLVSRLLQRLWVPAPPEYISDSTVLELELEAQRLIQGVILRVPDTVIVSNDVSGGLVSEYAAGRAFVDIVGRANRWLVDVADVAYLCVAGRLVSLHVLPNEPSWPPTETE